MADVRGTHVTEIDGVQYYFNGLDPVIDLTEQSMKQYAIW